MARADAPADGAREVVCVADERLARGLAGLMPVIEDLWPIAWAGPAGPEDPLRLATLDIADDAPATSPRRTPLLLVPPPGDGRTTRLLDGVGFADAPTVPWPFRGRSLDVRVEVDAVVHRSLPGHGGTVLMRATCGAPVWTVAGPAARPLHRTSLRLPALGGGDDIGRAAGGAAFLQVLPLFHLLREALGARAPVDPPLRAGFMVDDPNLHWPTYGHVDYRALAESAAREHYHVAFATVPLDAWWVHGGTAALFRSHPQQLSLLVHGNDHARRELTRDTSAATCAATLRQAQQRIAALERKAGVPVDRVMVPPHGACSARMLAALPRHGFEAACISAGSLRAHNADRRWSRRLGFAPAETAEGCTVLPRWPLAGTGLATLLVAAYLGQALILRGHHQDLRRGDDVLRAWAHAINGLGPVSWGRPAALARLAYRHRIVGTTLWIEPFAHRLEVRVPDGVDAVRIAAAAGTWGAVEDVPTKNPRQSGPRGGARDFVRSVAPGQALALVDRGAVVDRPPAPVDDPPVRPALQVRRVLTEARDRLRLNGVVRSALLGSAVR